MTNPAVVNVSPGEGESFFPLRPIYFGVRDADDRVNTNTAYAFATFSKTIYDPSVAGTPLPLTTPYIFDVFSDTVPVTTPSARADLQIGEGSVIDGRDVLVISSADATKRANTLFVHAEATVDAPLGAEFRFGVPVLPVRGAATPYQEGNADFSGILLGFVHWDKNTGVFIFGNERTDSTRYVRISGPLTESGRQAVVDYDVDWASPSKSFRIFFDASNYIGRAIVVLTDETTFEETKIYDEQISALGTMISTVRLGLMERMNPAAGVTGFIGVDQHRAGSLELYRLILETHGETLVAAAGVEYAQTGTAIASNLLAATVQADVAHMRQDKLTWLTGTDLLIFQAGITEDSRVRSEEPDLVSNKWLVFMYARPDQEAHLGSYNTGIGFDISDGTNVTRVRFLSDGETSIGVFVDTSGSGNYLISSNYETVPVLWEDDNASQMLFIADGTNIYTAIGADIRTSLPTELCPVPAVLADPEARARFDLGFVDQEIGIAEANGVTYDGFFIVENFIFCPVNDVVFVDITSWSNAGLAGTVSVTHTQLRPTELSPISYYYKSYTSTEYDPNRSGITLFTRAKIGDITDHYGQINPVRVPSPSFMSIRTSAGAGTADVYVQLQFVTSEDGSETFIFVSQDAQDYKEVLNPTSEIGRKISASIDPTIEHYYLLSVQPGKGLQLYVDFEKTPRINLAWVDISFAIKADTDTVLSGTTVAVGSIPTLKLGSQYNFMDVDVWMAGVGIGSGYDFAVTLGASSETLEEKIYGAAANLFFDVSDVT
jgi:hypothetical protein